MTRKTSKTTNIEELITTSQTTEQKEEDFFYEKCKICNNAFFKQIKYNLKHYDKYKLKQLTFNDIQYNGYSSDIIQFHIAECPGWLFGIWWNQPEEIEDRKKIEHSKYLSGTFFAQFEEIIDKFKPSCSEICYNFTICPDNDPETVYNLMDEAAVINFIHFYPSLAFCRDYLGWNYNL